MTRPLPEFHRRAWPTGLLSILWLICLLTMAPAQSRPRFAVADLAGEGQAETQMIRQLAAQDFLLTDEGQMRSALRGVGYTDSLNLTRDEARAIGMSIGCDYYLLGIVRVLRRLDGSQQTYYEGVAGLFTVETRSGELIRFELARTHTSAEETAREQLDEQIRQNWKNIVSAVTAAVARNHTASEIIGAAPLEGLDVIDITDDDAAARNVRQPIFYQRLRPAYTSEAESLSVTATVEIEAVFGQNGEVGESRVVRWAGFGLDESALATVRRLKFKPAERDGHPVSLRALVRYNFRRPPTAAQLKEQEERLRRSLRDLRQPQKPED